MLYTHLLSLPCFLFVAGDIIAHARQWLQPESYARFTLPLVGVELEAPLFLFLAINLLTQSATQQRTLSMRAL